MRICIITVANVPTEYNAAMSEQFQQLYGALVNPGTELIARGLKDAPAPDPLKLHDYRNHYYAMLLEQEVVRAVMSAEEEGFDAVVVNCFDDPGVKQARAVVNIPVFGICEPSLHFTCQLGRRFGALMPDMPGQASVGYQQIIDHGLTSRLIPKEGVRRESKPYIESQPESDGKPELMAGRLREEAIRMVHDGADAILIACGGLGAACDRSNFHHMEVDGQQIPVVTPLPVALKHAETMVAMNKAYGMPVHSRGQDGFCLTTEDKARIQQGFGVNSD